MKTLMILAINQAIHGNGYLLGIVVSIFLLAYLVLTLVKPDKF